MNIKEFALKKEVQIISIFVVVTATAYYFWLKKQKDDIKKS